jgi:hypothetical protein
VLHRAEARSPKPEARSPEAARWEVSGFREGGRNHLHAQQDGIAHETTANANRGLCISRVEFELLLKKACTANIGSNASLETCHIVLL